MRNAASIAALLGAAASIPGFLDTSKVESIRGKTDAELDEMDRREREQIALAQERRARFEEWRRTEARRRAKFASLNSGVEQMRDKELNSRPHTKVKGKAAKKAAKRLLRASGK
jgi:hypothetical protein